jgi:hypothetical protein
MISLYATGTATIEVGKFNGTMAEAREWFEAILAEVGATPKGIDAAPDEGAVYYSLPFQEVNYKLLERVATIEDLHGDPPMEYALVSHSEHSEKGYVRTGSYND